ncbi:MAG: WD40 repeat domain-containing protein, partial [Treponema sp.]|nr:WD40 repeat domain-containing protein [Treponema sp.]
MKADKRIGYIIGILIIAVYFFLAARPIPLETVLVPRWLNSVESGNPIYLAAGQAGESDDFPQTRIPFSLGSRFGYVSRDGFLSVNRVKKANVSLSAERWAEYEAEPERIVINDSNGEAVTDIGDPRGYPFFLDGRTFLIGGEQNVISEIDMSGNTSWEYEYASPLTCVDSAAGLVLVGLLDGIAGLLDSRGRQVFSFEPGGSRYSVILGCAISRDGTRLALISGIDDQRFLVLEHFGASASDYKVVYHEFLSDGFRRPVYISFIEDDRWIVFECGGGIGLYEISSRKSKKVELSG